MGILVDASSPVRWTGTNNNNIANLGGDTSASFTAPANALLVCCIQYDSNNVGTGAQSDIKDSGGLTWTLRVERLPTEATAGGGSAIWTAATTSSAARTVTAAYLVNGGPNSGTARISARCYVLTGADVSGTPVDTVGASNEGGSSTNDLTTSSVTPGADGLLVVADCDWNQLGVLTSSDLTIDSADYSGAISVASGYKACSSGVAAHGDLNAGGTAAAQHKWCQIVVRAAVVAGDTLMGQACL